MPAEPAPMTTEQQAMGEESGGHSQPRANQVPSEESLTNPNAPEKAFDSTLNICRGC
jgi:hypothetical protein